MNLKRWVSVVLLLVLVAFALQNAHVIQVDLLFWRFEASAALVIFLSVAIGFAAGFLGRGGVRRSARGGSPPVRP